MGLYLDSHKNWNISLLINFEYLVGKGYVCAVYQTFDKIMILITMALWNKVNDLHFNILIWCFSFDNTLDHCTSIASSILFENVIPRILIFEFSTVTSLYGQSLGSILFCQFIFS